MLHSGLPDGLVCRFANHRSFRDEQELLLMPSYDNDRDVVPVAAVFGANASGKSNLLSGLRLMSNLVQGWGTPKLGSGIPGSPSCAVVMH
jgi:uncharacterized protein